ncbi:NlpC/P60 family peptidoglycan-binding protein RipD [Mycobacterium sp.]|uniref:NlpC/P60 family peptidoglycan-binding protein RipD n=1 Tax=Mycobacterium sp. TaxID=1785 RepID=UPI003BAAD09D
MKRIYAFAIGLVMVIAPMVAAPGLAAADPGIRPIDYQQATDVVIARGLSQRGVPFSWAGGGISGPTRGQGTGIYTVGFDASGLIQYAYAGAGIKLPRSSGEMYKVGQKVLPQQARKGDLIFYGPEGTQSVTMYLGKGKMLEVSDTVQVSPVRSRDMMPYLVRILGTQPAQQSPLQQSPTSQAPIQRGRVQQAPTQRSPIQQAPTQRSPIQQAPVPQSPNQWTPAQQAPVTTMR